MAVLPDDAGWRGKLRVFNSCLLIVLGFALPFSVAVDGILAGLIAVLWLVGGHEREAWQKLRGNRVAWAVGAFYLLHVVGMMWTEDIAIGVRTLKKEALLLYLPVFMLVARYEHRRYYVFAFLAAMAVQVGLSYAIWFRLIAPFNIATQADPVPFMGHITYNPFLAIAIYFLLYFILFERSPGKAAKVAVALMVVPASINMFITQGRSGQLVYFVMLAMVVFQYYERYFFRALLVSVVAVSSTFAIMYQSNESFRGRMDQAIWDVRHRDTVTWSAVGARISFARNSFEILKRNPLIGVGTGDFNREYEKVDAQTTRLGATTNPHNMYSLEAVQFGILGLLSLVAILAAQIYEAARSRDSLGRRFGMALPVIFAFIMLSDSYLRGFFSTMLFTYLSSFIYRQWPDKV
jgi:O-antigen ligase